MCIQPHSQPPQHSHSPTLSPPIPTSPYPYPHICTPPHHSPPLLPYPHPIPTPSHPHSHPNSPPPLLPAFLAAAASMCSTRSASLGWRTTVTVPAAPPLAAPAFKFITSLPLPPLLPFSPPLPPLSPTPPTPPPSPSIPPLSIRSLTLAAATAAASTALTLPPAVTAVALTSNSVASQGPMAILSNWQCRHSIPITPVSTVRHWRHWPARETRAGGGCQHRDLGWGGG